MVILVLLVLLLLAGYVLALIAFNNANTAVDLLFYQSPTLPLGILLIITLLLGAVLGSLLGVLVFKVIPHRMELRRLRKENQQLQGQLHQLQKNVLVGQEVLSPVPVDVEIKS